MARVGGSKYFDWKKRYGKVNEHNGAIPRDHWLDESERNAILEFHAKNPLEGYRRLTFMMLDANVVAASPSSVYRVLSQAGILCPFQGKRSSKGTGFTQPLTPHEHWHLDISYLNICGTFYFMCSILDGCSRAIIHWEIREKVQEIDIETIVQRGREKYPDARPRVITDNGPQFISRDFKEFLDPSIETFVSEKLIELRVENVTIRSRKRIHCDKKFLLKTFFATPQNHKTSPPSCLPNLLIRYPPTAVGDDCAGMS